MRAASQLPGSGPTVVDMAVYLHVNQNSDDDDDDALRKAKIACNFGLSECNKVKLYFF